MLTKEETTFSLCRKIILGVKTLQGHSRTKTKSAGYGSAFVQIHSSLECVSGNRNGADDMTATLVADSES
jgi:hypothetical protein